MPVRVFAEIEGGTRPPGDFVAHAIACFLDIDCGPFCEEAARWWKEHYPNGSPWQNRIQECSRIKSLLNDCKFEATVTILGNQFSMENKDESTVFVDDGETTDQQYYAGLLVFLRKMLQERPNMDGVPYEKAIQLVRTCMEIEAKAKAA